MTTALVSCPCGRACDDGACLTMPVWDLPAVPTSRDGWQRPDEVAEWVRANGAVDAMFEALLATVHCGELSARGRVDALAALEQYKAAVEAAQVRLIATMAADDPDGKQWAREDVAAALRVSPRTASNRMALAEAVSSRFPATMSLLHGGRTTLLHARVLDEHTAHLDDGAARRVEAMVLEKAQRQTVGEFGRTVKRAVLRVDAASAEQRHDLARNDRRLSVQAREHGMAELWWLLPAEQAAHVVATLEPVSRPAHPGDPRSADQRRSDALYALITHDCAAGPIDAAEPRLHGMRPAVQVTVPLAVLCGDSDAPGELSGYGPIPAGLARRIAADPTGTWRRLVVDPRGRLLEFGRSTYRPPADLAQFVIARDQTCCFPGCARPASRCELDHCRDWDAGGQTGARNLHALCARHHHLKHETGWQYYELPNGDIEWASPTGHRYVREARTHPDAHPPPSQSPSGRTPRGRPPPDDPPN